MNKDRRFRATSSRSHVLAPLALAALLGLSNVSFAQDDDFDALFGPEPEPAAQPEASPSDSAPSEEQG